jgi:hypothetical protein
MSRQRVIVAQLSTPCEVKMTGNDDFRVRPGRIRSTRSPRSKSFLAQALKATQKAGGFSRGGPRRSSSAFGRGRAASLTASRFLNSGARGAVVKARVVRRLRSPGALRAHIGYLQRDGVTRDGRLASCSMLQEARPTAAPSPDAARVTGIISGSSSRPTMQVSCKAYVALPAS